MLFRAHADHGFPLTVVRPSHTYDDAQPPLPGGWTTVDRIARGDEVVGQGRYVSYRLNQSHPFANELTVMFKREAERVEGLFDLIRVTADRMRPPPMAIWLCLIW